MSQNIIFRRGERSLYGSRRSQIPAFMAPVACLCRRATGTRRHYRGHGRPASSPGRAFLVPGHCSAPGSVLTVTCHRHSAQVSTVRVCRCVRRSNKRARSAGAGPATRCLYGAGLMRDLHNITSARRRNPVAPAAPAARAARAAASTPTPTNLSKRQKKLPCYCTARCLHKIRYIFPRLSVRTRRSDGSGGGQRRPARPCVAPRGGRSAVRRRRAGRARVRQGRRAVAGAAAKARAECGGGRGAFGSGGGGGGGRVRLPATPGLFFLGPLVLELRTESQFLLRRAPHATRSLGPRTREVATNKLQFFTARGTVADAQPSHLYLKQTRRAAHAAASS
ncbi:hypothetical protein EVAR_12487_1 [Eumeta japonica]|uniref:Uncharacterized protein n=1 Tax=Eumeta variegata TaxID=151549 RepID=A0A4C1TPL3_EUMVA|nr:hypothetical protein EVAR_12487_1 [Eumeta japonica]